MSNVSFEIVIQLKSKAKFHIFVASTYVLADQAIVSSCIEFIFNISFYCSHKRECCERCPELERELGVHRNKLEHNESCIKSICKSRWHT
jgi:hypothetical protein